MLAVEIFQIEHLTFALLLPVYPSTWMAFTAIVVLGVSFSLVPAALWPSVLKREYSGVIKHAKHGHDPEQTARQNGLHVGEFKFLFVGRGA